MDIAHLPPVLCVSTADWDAVLWTNKQHLMSRLAARGVSVLYIDSLGHRSPGASKQDLARMWNRIRAWRPHAREVMPNLFRDSPLVVPAHSRASIRAVNRRLLQARLRRNERRHDLKRAVIWAFSPAAIDIYRPERDLALVYHCVDDLASYPGIDAEAFSEQERRICGMADVCIASSKPLVELLEKRGATEILYWPNPADSGAFAAALSPPRSGPDLTVGFIGAVQEHKLDLELMDQCARLRPNWSFELVGPVGLGLRSSSIKGTGFPPNLRFPGVATRDELPGVVGAFDVAIIPYRLNEYTKHVFPMKVFEYLAAGKPVVSTPLPSLVGEVEFVRFAATAEEFVQAIESSAAEDVADPGRSVARSRYASGFSWEARTSQALDLLNRLSI